MARAVSVADDAAASAVRERAAVVVERIRRAGGDPAAVRIVAVTKGFPASAPAAALAAGLADLGESYAQELVAKAAELGEPAEPGEAAAPEAGSGPRWHFVGRLQRNKVRALAPLVALWQSVDRLSLGREIAKRAPGAAVLVQVNVSDEPQKGGCAPGEVADLVSDLDGLGLAVEGLMGLGPMGAPEEARPAFARLHRLADVLGLRERSMGMTGDLEVAVQEGATMVRVGEALFGPRPPRSGGPRRPAGDVGH